MSHRAHQLALRFLRKEWNQADEHERRILLAIAEQLGTHRDARHQDTRSLGERLADRIAEFGGSWPFITIFCVVLLAWIALNSWIMVEIDDLAARVESGERPKGAC